MRTINVAVNERRYVMDSVISRRQAIGLGGIGAATLAVRAASRAEAATTDPTPVDLPDITAAAPVPDQVGGSVDDETTWLCVTTVPRCVTPVVGEDNRKNEWKARDGLSDLTSSGDDRSRAR